MEKLQKRIRRLEWVAGICLVVAVAASFLAFRLNYVLATAKSMNLKSPGYHISAVAGAPGMGDVVYLYNYDGPVVLLRAAGDIAEVSIAKPGFVTGISLKMAKSGVASITVPDLNGQSALVITNESGKAAIVHKPYWQTR